MSFSVYGIDYSIGCLLLLKVVRKGIWSSAPTCMGRLGMLLLLLALFLGLGLLLRSLSPRTFAMGDYYIQMQDTILSSLNFTHPDDYHHILLDFHNIHSFTNPNPLKNKPISIPPKMKRQSSVSSCIADSYFI